MAVVPVLFLIILVHFQAVTEGNAAKSHSTKVLSKITSKNSLVNEIISEECEAVGICEDSMNYPHTLASKLAQELKEAGVPVDSDKRPTIPSLVSRGSFDGEPTCNSTNALVTPLMIRDATDGTWYYTVNNKSDPLQVYNVQICAKPSRGSRATMECTNQLILNDDYESRCIQKYITRTVQVVKDGKAFAVLGDIPCCCTCVAIDKYQ